MRLVSTYQKIQKLAKLTRHDVTAWEHGFILNVVDKAERAVAAGQVTALSDRQLEHIEALYTRHFPEEHGCVA